MKFILAFAKSFKSFFTTLETRIWCSPGSCCVSFPGLCLSDVGTRVAESHEQIHAAALFIGFFIRNRVQSCSPFAGKKSGTVADYPQGRIKFKSSCQAVSLIVNRLQRHPKLKSLLLQRLAHIATINSHKKEAAMIFDGYEHHWKCRCSSRPQAVGKRAARVTSVKE